MVYGKGAVAATLFSGDELSCGADCTIVLVSRNRNHKNGPLFIMRDRAVHQKEGTADSSIDIASPFGRM
jgi:hypothetical protein